LVLSFTTFESIKFELQQTHFQLQKVHYQQIYILRSKQVNAHLIR